MIRSWNVTPTLVASRSFISHWKPVNKADLRGRKEGLMSWNPARQAYAFALAQAITIEAVLKTRWGMIGKRLDRRRSVSLLPPTFSRFREKRSSRGKTAESRTWRDISFFLMNVLSKEYLSRGVLIKKVARKTAKNCGLLQIYKYNY